MYIVELKTGEWFCTESKKLMEEKVGKAGSSESFEKSKNLWFQPFNYLSGVMSDFFLVIQDGEKLEQGIPMRGWYNELPLSKCIEGGVIFLGKKEPKWYRDLLANQHGR